MACSKWFLKDRPEKSRVIPDYQENGLPLVRVQKELSKMPYVELDRYGRCDRCSCRYGDECTEVEPPSSDKCVKSKQVFGLDEQNFKPFLCSKSIALVMFYEPDNPGFEFSRMHFKKPKRNSIEVSKKKEHPVKTLLMTRSAVPTATAAETTTRNNHAYAAVNCHTAPEVCCSEDVKRVPHFKLYARGRLVGFNDNARLFTSKDMKNWVELGVKGKRL